MGWPHTSLAMTPEHSVTNGEKEGRKVYDTPGSQPGRMGGIAIVHCCTASQCRELVPELCKSRALQEHVPLITQSSSVTEPTHTPVARQVQMAALLNRQQMRPHAKSQNSLQLCSAHGDFPIW